MVGVTAGGVGGRVVGGPSTLGVTTGGVGARSESEPGIADRVPLPVGRDGPGGDGTDGRAALVGRPDATGCSRVGDVVLP